MTVLSLTINWRIWLKSTTSSIRSPRHGIGIALATIVWLAVLPVAAVLTLGVPVPFIVGVAAGYAAQIGVFAFMLFWWRVPLRDPWIWIAFCYGFFQIVTVVLTTLQQGSYEQMDLINAIAKAIGVLLYAGMFQAVVPTETDIRRFLLGFLGLAGIAILVNVILNGSDFSQVMTIDSSYGLDFSSFFANRNQFGMFLFLSIVAHTLYLHGRSFNWVNLTFFLAQIASLLLTMSRGSILAVILFIFCLVALQFRRRPAFLIFGFGLVAATWAGIRYSGLNELIGRIFLRSDSGLTGRDSLWSAGLQIWSDYNIFFGVGSFRGIEIAQESGMEFEEFHSFMVETLVSGGLVEIAILAFIFFIVWRRVSSSALDSYRRRVLFCSAVGVFALSFIESISFFTIGLVGTMFTIFMVTLPILYSRLPESGNDGGKAAQ